MKNFQTLIMLAVLSAAAPISANEAAFSTDSIVKLVKSGLGDEAVIAKIRADDISLDLSVDQMIALKDQGVSSAVIAALIEPRGPSAPVMSLDSPDPMVPHPAGVYFLSGTGEAARMVKMNPTVSNQAKTGGIWGYALTGGLASMSIKATIPNETAKIRTSVRPVFYFFFDQSNDVQASNAWEGGANVSVTSPAEFSLVALTQKKGRREARVGSTNIGGAKIGVMDKDRIPFDYTEVRPGVFRVEATNIPGAGEYGFMFALNGAGAGGALTARIFDFSAN